MNSLGSLIFQVGFLFLGRSCGVRPYGIQRFLDFYYSYALGYDNGYNQLLKFCRLRGVFYFRDAVSAHVHKLVEGLPVISTEGVCEAAPSADFTLACGTWPLLRVHALCLHFSYVGYVGVDKVLFR
jgi:hypothetical protein